MNSVLRPNYRRARALALEIEAAKNHLDDALDAAIRDDDEEVLALLLGM